MKKLILGAAMMIGFISLSTAQQVATTKPTTKNVTPATAPAAKSSATTSAAKPPATATAAKPPVTATPAKTPATATAAKPPATTKAKEPTAAKPTNAQGQVVKKDGTPDKRYNNPPAATGPVKKDGTPDKRYKENKKN